MTAISNFGAKVGRVRFARGLNDNAPVVLLDVTTGTSLLLAPTRVYHSPDGFEWGYSGSGPADLALNLLDRFVDRATAWDLHQEFKRAFIATLPASGGEIAGEAIRVWIGNRLEEQGRV